MGFSVRLFGLEDPKFNCLTDLIGDRKIVVIEGEPGSGRTTISLSLSRKMVGCCPAPWVFGEVSSGVPVLVEDVDCFGPAFQEALSRDLRRKRSFPLFIITARDLDSAFRSGRMKRSLYAKLESFKVELVPLRERKELIPLYAGSFLKDVSSSMGKEGLSFDHEVLDVFKFYSWPGNLKELKNVISFMVASSSSYVLDVSHLPKKMRKLKNAVRSSITFRDLIKLELEAMVEELNPDDEIPGSIFRDVVSLVEEVLLRSALERTGGVRTKAAKLLGINRNTLSKKIKEYGIDEG